MLKDVWKKAVCKYQEYCQEGDQATIEQIDKRIKEAEKGYVTTVYVGPAMYCYAAVSQEKLTPEEAADYIAERQRERADLVRAMEQRREKYGLKI